MAFQPSAPPLSGPLEVNDESKSKPEGKPSSSAQSLPTHHQLGYALEPHHHHHQRYVSDPPPHHHYQSGFVAPPLFQPPAEALQYPSMVPPPDTSVVFGFPVGLPRSNTRWHTSLCACCSDPTICLLGWCCPCILFGKIAEDLDDGATSCLAAATIWYILQQFTACGWLYSFGYRDKLRSRYGLTRRPGCDCIVHFCCWPCAFCQEYREIQTRRLENEAVLQGYTTLAPPPQQIMRY